MLMMLTSRLRLQPKRFLLGLMSLVMIFNLFLLFKTSSIVGDSIKFTAGEISAENYTFLLDDNMNKNVEEKILLKVEDDTERNKIDESRWFEDHKDDNENQIINDLRNGKELNGSDNEDEKPSCELWVNFAKQIVEISPKTNPRECSLYLVVDPNNRKLSTTRKYSILKVTPTLRAILADLKVYSLLSTYIYSNIHNYQLFVFASFIDINEQKNTHLAYINSLKNGIEYFFLNSTTKQSESVLVVGSNTFMKIDENNFPIEQLNNNEHGLFDLLLPDNFSPNAFIIHQYTNFVKDFFSNIETEIMKLQKQLSNPQIITFDDIFRRQVLHILNLNITKCRSSPFCGWDKNRTDSLSGNLLLLKQEETSYYLLQHFKGPSYPNHLVYEINEESPFTVYPHPPYFAQLMNHLNKFKNRDENFPKLNDKRYLGLKCEIQVDLTTFHLEVIRESISNCAIYQVTDIHKCVSPLSGREGTKPEFALLRAGSSIDFIVKSKFKIGLISSLYYAQSYGYRLFYYDASKDLQRDDIWLKSHIPKEKGVDALFSLFDYENSSEKAVYYMDVDGLMTDVVNESFSIENVVKMSKLNENHQFDLLLQDEYHVCAGVFLIWKTQFGRSFFPSVREACEHVFPYCLPHPWEQNMFQRKLVRLMNGTNNFLIEKDEFFLDKTTEETRKWFAWSTYFQTFMSKRKDGTRLVRHNKLVRRKTLPLLSTQIWPHVAFAGKVPQLHTCLWGACASDKQGLFYHSGGAYFEQRTQENNLTRKVYQTLDKVQKLCKRQIDI